MSSQVTMYFLYWMTDYYRCFTHTHTKCDFNNLTWWTVSNKRCWFVLFIFSNDERHIPHSCFYFCVRYFFSTLAMQAFFCLFVLQLVHAPFFWNFWYKIFVTLEYITFKMYIDWCALFSMIWIFIETCAYVVWYWIYA